MAMEVPKKSRKTPLELWKIIPRSNENSGRNFDTLTIQWEKSCPLTVTTRILKIPLKELLNLILCHWHPGRGVATQVKNDQFVELGDSEYLRGILCVSNWLKSIQSPECKWRISKQICHWNIQILVGIHVSLVQASWKNLRIPTAQGKQNLRIADPGWARNANLSLLDPFGSSKQILAI